MQTKRIETYSLFEFCQAVQESVIAGWRFDFDSNEMFPTAFGSMLVTGMVKSEDNTEEVCVKPEEVQQDCDPVGIASQVKRGRKPKDSI
jgi:hypothetical protein